MEMDPEYQAVFGDYEVPEEEPPAGEPSDAERTDGGSGAAAGEEAPPRESAAADSQEPSGEAPEDGAAEQAEREPRVQPPEDEEQRRAARRREWQEREERAAQARVDKVYADLFRGQTDPATGRPITCEADYRAFRQRQEQQAQEQALRDAGLRPEVLERLVDRRVAQHPAVTAAQEAVQTARAQQARAAEQQAQAAIAAELAKISAVDPGVKTLEDIARMPTAAEFDRYVRMGNTLTDAFYLANRQEIDRWRAAAARQSAINQARGKQGLLSGAGDGAAGAGVPAEAAAAYRQIMPEATDEEIARAWASYQKACR